LKHSPEGFLESTIKDGSPDKIAAQAMVREANSFALMGLDLKNDSKSFKFDQAGKYEFLKPEQIMRNRQEKISDEMRGRDKVSFVSAAFCNPLFLVGMGAAFAILDDLRQAREARMAEILSGNFSADTINSVRRQADSDNQEKATVMRVETEEEKKKRLLLEATGLLGSGEKSLAGGGEKSILKNGLRAHQVRKEMREKMRAKLLSGLEKGWDEKANQKSIVSWIKSNKLFKNKMKLENMMEKSRGKESLTFVSNLQAKLDQVDKALKRIGA